KQCSLGRWKWVRCFRDMENPRKPLRTGQPSPNTSQIKEQHGASQSKLGKMGKIGCWDVTIRANAMELSAISIKANASPGRFHPVCLSLAADKNHQRIPLLVGLF